MPWTDQPTALVPLCLMENDGTPFAGDARNALGMVLDRFAARDLYPVVGIELEFYLADPQGGSDGAPDTPVSPLTGAKPIRDGALAIDEVNDHDALINEIYAACQLQMIEADTTISEAGLGQFEINLLHSTDAMKAADDAAFFKQIAKGWRGNTDLPPALWPNPISTGRAMECICISACLMARDAMSLTMAARLEVIHFAMPSPAVCLVLPIRCWFCAAPEFVSPVCDRITRTNERLLGYENRTAAIRVPLGPPSQRRIEHRVPGADTNPYLVLATILAAMLTGIEDLKSPPEPLSTSAYALDLPVIPTRWEAAIDRFAQSPLIARMLPVTLRDMFVDCKRQELLRFSGDVSPFEYHSYLDQV